MRRLKLFPIIIFLLVLGVNFPGWGDTFPTEKWSFMGVDNPYPGNPNFDIWGVPSSPAIGDDGTVYVGSLNGHFFAIYPDGNLKWVNAELGGSFAYTPAIADNGIIYASNGNGLYAFDQHDGSVLWSYYAPCLFFGAPAIARDGTVYIGSNSDRLFAFTPKLEKKWEFFGENTPYYQQGQFGEFGNPVIDVDGTIYCVQHREIVSGEECGFLHSIKPDGEPGPWCWVKDSLRADISPAITGGTIYVAAYDGRLYSVSITQGTMNWSHLMQYSSPTGAPVTGAGGTVYAAYGNILYGLNPTDGTHQWSQMAPPDMSIRTPAIGADGKIYFGTYGFSAGEFVGGIFFATPGGSNYSLQLEGQVHSSPAIVKSANQGVLYLGCERSVRAFNVDSPGIARSAWPVDRANLKRNARASLRFHIFDLIEAVKQCAFINNISKSLVSKLEAAEKSLEKENTTSARNQVTAFINELTALKRRKIMAREADRLITSAQRIIDFL